MHGTLKYKVRRAGNSKPVITGRTGASQSADGTWSQVEQQVDKETGRYVKRVTTHGGLVIKDYEGPLSGGHGGPPLQMARRRARMRAFIARVFRGVFVRR